MLNNKMQYSQNRIKLLICCTGLLVMFVAEAWGGTVMNEYLHTAWIAVFALAMPYEGVLYLLTFLFPLCTLLSHFAHVFIVLFIVIIGKRVLLRRDGGNKILVLLLIAFFAVCELFAHYYYGVSTFNKALGYVSTVALFFWLLYEKDHGDYRKHMKLYVFAVFSLCVITLVNTILSHQGNWIADFFGGGLRLGNTGTTDLGETDVKINANSLAYYSISAVACALYMIGNVKNKTVSATVFDIAQLVLIAIVGMLTVSRSWLLVFALLIFLFYIARTKSTKNAYKVIALSVGILLLVTVVMNSSFMDAFIQRFEVENTGTAGGRTEIMADYFEMFFANTEYMFFGTGVSDYSAVANMTWSMHNATQQIIVCLGIPAATVFFIAMLRPIFKAKGRRRISVQCWLPFIAVVLFAQTIQFLNPNTLMFPYVMSLYALKMQDR